jgi:hypothetical protein
LGEYRILLAGPRKGRAQEDNRYAEGPHHQFTISRYPEIGSEPSILLITKK